MANLTIKDIAKICGVGISTVSRAINDDPGINQNTRKRILKVIDVVSQRLSDIITCLIIVQEI